MKTLSLFPITALLIGSVLLVSCAGTKNHDQLQTVSHLNPKQYAGTWHEVARLPNFFEKDVIAATAIYGETSEPNRISVLNQGLKSNGKHTEISGFAYPSDSKTPSEEAKLKVRFTRFPASLFAGDYWILSLNKAHTRAVVGTPSRKYLWLLAKDPTDQVSDFKEALEKAKQDGFDIDALIINPKRLP